MLAPFTAGWQTTELQPLVIEKSEVYLLNFSIVIDLNCHRKINFWLLDQTCQGCYVYDANGKKYLDALAGLWCTVLGTYNLFLAIVSFLNSKTLKHLPIGFFILCNLDS